MANNYNNILTKGEKKTDYSNKDKMSEEKQAMALQVTIAIRQAIAY